SRPMSAPSPSSDRNLLFGIIALQLNFIDRDALVAAIHAWVADKSRSLSQILCAQGALPDDRRQLLKALVEEHLRAHGGDAPQSLAALSSISSARDALQAIADADVQASLAHLTMPGQLPRGEVPTGPDLSDPTLAGRRFRV